jgi:hypothetical protein
VNGLGARVQFCLGSVHEDTFEIQNVFFFKIFGTLNHIRCQRVAARALTLEDPQVWCGILGVPSVCHLLYSSVIRARSSEQVNSAQCAWCLSLPAILLQRISTGCEPLRILCAGCSFASVFLRSRCFVTKGGSTELKLPHVTTCNYVKLIFCFRYGGRHRNS